MKQRPTPARDQSYWVVSASYAAPGGRARHPSREVFRGRSIVGPAAPATVEAVLDLLEVPENFRVKIRADTVVKDFVEGKLVPDPTYPHHMTGGCYVHSNTPKEQFVEWDLAFAFVTRILKEASS